MSCLYYANNGAMVTTAALVPVATGTAIKTMLQIATPSTVQLRVVEWGISFAGFAAALPVRCELIDTNVAATVTAHVAAGMQPYNAESASMASQMTLGTSASGYTATVEGTITATKTLDNQLISPTTAYVKQYALGNEPRVAESRFLRVRVTAGTDVGCSVYVIWAE